MNTNAEQLPSTYIAEIERLNALVDRLENESNEEAVAARFDAERMRLKREEEFEDILALVRRHELDCFRTGDEAGERVLARLRDELERGEHRR